MPLIKAYYIISAVAVVHLAMGYYLIAAPEKIATQSTIFILGEALGLVSVLRRGMAGAYLLTSLFHSNNQGHHSTKIHSHVPSPVSF